MKLGVSDRLVLLNLLPAEGNILTIRIVRELKDELSFSEQELADIKLEQVDDRIKWDSNIDLSKEVKIGDTAKGIIVKALKQLDETEKLTASHMQMYEAFVG